MPFKCAIYGCSNTSDVKKHISVHRIPYYGDSRPEAVRRRKRWVDFVKRKRDKWEPTKWSAVCSTHFTEDDFQRKIHLPGLTEPGVPHLKADDLGISVFPSLQAPDDNTESTELSEGAARVVRRKMRVEINVRDEPSTSQAYRSIAETELEAQDVEIEEAHSHTKVKNVETEDVEIAAKRIRIPASEIEESCVMASDMQVNQFQAEKFTQTFANQQCEQCMGYQKEIRLLKNKLINQQEKLLKEKAVATELKSWHTVGNQESSGIRKDCEDVEMADFGNLTSDATDPITSDDYPMSDDMVMKGDEEDTGSSSEGSSGTDENIRTEPKYIVFLSQLMLLFQFCRSCGNKNLVSTTPQGTMISVETHCGNPKCNEKEFVWQSQPRMEGTKAVAGNILLSFAILLAGASATKVFRVFSHMGIMCHSLRQFYRHQKEKLFPAISIYWNSHQKELMEEVKEDAVIAGDGRHDSMGHSAKYCAYTLFDCTSSNIFHFSLVQRNQAGSSQGMEYMAFKQCLNFMTKEEVTFSSLITDRHSSIAKHMREYVPNIHHYFDLWHLRKKIRKVLTKIGKIANCEDINPWIRACENHLSWSAISTHSGDGNVIVAKFLSFLEHILDKHENLSNPIFNQCAHGEIQQREWLDEQSVVFDKAKKALTNKRLISGIKQASPLNQTSCVEGFHSVLNHFAPKMIAFSYTGMYIRHIIAILHFNKNLHREIRKKGSDGSAQIAVVYPKFKNGEATVRDVKVQACFSYVQDVWETVVLSIAKNDVMEKERLKLKEQAPDPMNSMLVKQNRNDALRKREERKRMEVKDVPATSEPQVTPCTAQPSTREKPRCRDCRQPMKGHKDVVNCPRNQRT